MASIRREFTVAATPDVVWAAVLDFGNLHRRLATGFVIDCSMVEGDGRSPGDVRAVSFANGAMARERLIGVDHAARRIAYTVVGSELTHHQASAEVQLDADGATRFVWTTDLLPDAMAPYVASMMEQGLQSIRARLSQSESA